MNIIKVIFNRIKRVFFSFILSIISLILVFTVWYYLQWDSSIPYYRPNDFFFNANTEYLDLVRRYDFSIAYHRTSVDEGFSSYKILCRKGKYNWEFITISYELPFNCGAKKIDFIGVSNEEANLFLDSLTRYDFFSIPEEAQLKKKCDTYISHQSKIEIDIIQGIKARKLKFTSPDYWHSKCPDVKEWSSIQKFSLFLDNWQCKKPSTIVLTPSEQKED